MEIFIDVGLFILGFIILIAGANYFVEYTVLFGRKLRVSELTIGLTVAAMGTSLPELTVSATAAIKGTSEIAIGNVVGSNIFNILFILAISAFITPIIVSFGAVKKDIPIMIIVTLILFLLGLDGKISFIDGTILIGSFLVYIIYLIMQGKKNADNYTMTFDERPSHNVFFIIAMTIVGLSLVILGSKLAVDNAADIARYLGVSERVIGLTLIAAGTSMPELITSIVAAKNGKNDLAVGNIVGSNIFNIICILGVIGVISPIRITPHDLIDIGISLAAGVVLLMVVYKDYIIGRLDSVVMLGCYLLFMAYVVM